MASTSGPVKNAVVLFLIPVLSGCSFVPGSTDKAFADEDQCGKMIGQGDIARLNGEYTLSNQNYLDAIASDACKNMQRSPGLRNPDDSYTYIADNYQAIGDDKNAILYYDKSPGKGNMNVRYSKLISTGKSDPSKRASVIQEISTTYKKYQDVRFYDLRYLNGERTTALLKLYLEAIDIKLSGQLVQGNTGYLDYYTLLIHSKDYDIPVKLATELNQTKVATALMKQQQDIISVENVARAQNIPGPGTSSGHADLVARRGAFYAQAYRAIGLTNLADIYQSSYETSQQHAVAVANQRAIDEQDEANKAAQDSAESAANVQMFTSLLTNMTTTYAATHGGYSTGSAVLPISSGQADNPAASGTRESCDHSTVSGFSHCCLAIRHGSISTYQRKDGLVDYACHSPGGDVEACTYNGATLVPGVAACGVN